MLTNDNPQTTPNAFKFSSYFGNLHLIIIHFQHQRLKHSHQPEETLGTISLRSRALRRGETGFQRVLVNSPRGLAALVVGRLVGRFRYAYHLRPWEKFDVLCWYFILFQLLVLVNWIFFC